MKNESEKILWRVLTSGGGGTVFKHRHTSSSAITSLWLISSILAVYLCYLRKWFHLRSSLVWQPAAIKAYQQRQCIGYLCGLLLLFCFCSWKGMPFTSPSRDVEAFLCLLHLNCLILLWGSLHSPDCYFPNWLLLSQLWCSQHKQNSVIQNSIAVSPTRNTLPVTLPNPDLRGGLFLETCLSMD